MKRTLLGWLAGLLSLSSACGGGTGGTPVRVPWVGATPLTAPEDHPSGVAIAGTNVVFTTGRTTGGENAVRIAPLVPASPPASRILVAHPGGRGLNGVLAVDGDEIYVAAGVDILRVSTVTGAVVPVVSGRPAEVSAVAVDDRFVWWTTSQYQAPLWTEVARIPKGGGALEMLASGADDSGRVFQDDPARKAVAVRHSAFHSLVLDGDGALVANPGELLRVVAGRAPQVVLGGSKLFGGALAQVAVDADHLYVEIAGDHDQLFAVPRPGGVPMELARGTDNADRILVAGREVIFMAPVGPVGTGGRENINAVPTEGGAVRVVTSGRAADGDLAIDGNRLVFSADDRVWSVPVQPG